MNETQVNNFLRCLSQIDDFNYLALHARPADIGSNNSSTTPSQKKTLGVYKDINGDHTDYDHDDHDHASEGSNSDDLLIAKVTAIFVLFTASAICGSIPFLLNRFFRWTETHPNARSGPVVKGLLYFGGGILLATTFLHLLPEVQEIVEQLQTCNILPQLPFSLAELLMCTGFFLMHLIEELLHSFVYRNKYLMEHDCGAGAAFERGRSIRKSYLVKGNSKATTALVGEMDKNEDNPITKLEFNSDNKIVNTLVPIVTNTSECSGSLSMQNLIVSDVESPMYRGQPYQNDMPANCQNQTQKTPKENQKLPRGHHQHSHLPLDLGGDGGDVITSSLRGLFIVLALSLHELFEGIAVGLESNAQDVWFMFGAVSAHKFVLAFCVGVELIVANTRIALSAVYILTFAIVSPIGIGIGIWISQSDDATSPNLSSAILQGLACGTLLYVVFFEILSKHQVGLVTYLSLLAGFLIMFGIQQLGANGHEHSHGGCNASHDHSDQKNRQVLLLKEAQNTTQVPIYTFHSQLNHHESRNSADANGNFERELQILRQASKKLVQNISHVD